MIYRHTNSNTYRNAYSRSKQEDKLAICDGKVKLLIIVDQIHSAPSQGKSFQFSFHASSSFSFSIPSYPYFFLTTLDSSAISRHKQIHLQRVNLLTFIHYQFCLKLLLVVKSWLVWSTIHSKNNKNNILETPTLPLLSLPSREDQGHLEFKWVVHN